MSTCLVQTEVVGDPGLEYLHHQEEKREPRDEKQSGKQEDNDYYTHNSMTVVDAYVYIVIYRIVKGVYLCTCGIVCMF